MVDGESICSGNVLVQATEKEERKKLELLDCATMHSQSSSSTQGSSGLDQKVLGSNLSWIPFFMLISFSLQSIAFVTSTVLATCYYSNL